MFAGTYAPQGWHLCDGSLLPVAQNQSLFSLLGTKYGGDGVNTFGLPDCRGRLVVHNGTNPNTGTSYQLGQMQGTETVTLSLAQLPSHTHTVLANAAEVTSGSPVGGYSGSNAVSPQLNAFSTATTNLQAMSTAAVTTAGGGQPHSNLMPFVVLNYIIALGGTYPQQEEQITVGDGGSGDV
jgi:microcystin-dependent protein